MEHKMLLLKDKLKHPGCCGSVDRVLACELKGRRFNSQLGYLPVLWARFPGVGHARGNQTLMFLSLSYLCLKINK